MTTTKSFYSCSSSSSEGLFPADATQLPLSYQYEIETSSSSLLSIDEAIERVQSAMLFQIARQSGLLDCPTIIADEDTTGLEKQNSSWRRRHRQLGNDEGMVGSITRQQQQKRPWRGLRGLSEAARPSRERGSNSIVGLSSLPVDVALVDVPCHSLAAAEMARSGSSSGGGDNTNDYLFSSATRQVSPGMAGMVAMGEKEGVGNKVVMDGETTEDSLRYAIAPRSSSSSSSSSAIDKNADDSEEGAFNYISTQSKPKSSSTLHQLRNPSIVPAHEVLIMQPTPTQSSQSSVSKLQPLARNIDDRYGNNNNINHSYRNSDTGGTSSRRSKCTVIQGHMSIYTTTSPIESSTYENLQGRILYAIAETVDLNKLLGFPSKNSNHQDGILAVRMHSDIPYANNYGSGVGGVSSINSSSQESTSSSTNNFEFLSNVPMIPVMIAVGVLLLAVLVLFIGTSRPNKRRRRSNNDYSSNNKEETATIMSAKTMDIDLDAGEEMELQSAAISLQEEAGDAPKRKRSGGIGLVASGIRNVAARRQRSNDIGDDGGGNRGGVGGRGGGVHGGRDAERMAEEIVVVPNTPKYLLYSSASLPSPTQRTPLRSLKASTTSSPGGGVSAHAPRTPKSVPRTPRAITPDVEVELDDYLFPSTPAAASCHSRNSLLGTPSSPRQGRKQEAMVQKLSSAGGGPQSYLDMLATTFCINPQYEDVEVCLRPIDDCTECVENEFCAPFPSTPSSTKKVQSKERETNRERNKKIFSDTVPNYVFAEDEDGGVRSNTNRDDEKKSEVNIPTYVFAEKGGTANRVDRMKSDAMMTKEKKEGRGGIFQETFENKFGDTCGGGGGRRFLKRNDLPDVNEVSIEEIHEIYSYDDNDNRRRASVRRKDFSARRVSETSSEDGSVFVYNPTTACNDDNWFFSWW